MSFRVRIPKTAMILSLMVLSASYAGSSKKPLQRHSLPKRHATRCNSKQAAPQSVKGDEDNLRRYEKSVFSQNGEDGIIEKIFEIVGTSSKYCVEFGAADGFGGSNTRLLRDRDGWKALLLDSDYENLEINLHKARITAENINDLFEQYGTPHDLDLISIDIDFNDFYVWKAIDEKYQPRLVVIEYNATHLPDEDKTVIYDPNGRWDGTNYYGASILALYNLARQKGYSLIYAESRGVNLFFLRDDLAKQYAEHFKNVNDVSKLYVTPNYGTGPNGGHRQDPLNRSFISSTSFLE